MSRRGTTPEAIKLVIVGSGGAGKTTLIHQYMFSTFLEEYEPTKADSFRKAITIERKVVQFDILDTAGQEDMMRQSYFKDGDGFLMVYAIDNKASFDAIKPFYEEILLAKENAEFPSALIANKSDLEKKREVSKEEGQKLANELKCSFYEITAKQQGQVGNVFSTIAISIFKYKMESMKQPNESKCNCLIL